ncbi:MAG: hypothetical protein KBG35_06665, partial [Thauera sp.]|nr:hypothetical protein [Thauera sp.]
LHAGVAEFLAGDFADAFDVFDLVVRHRVTSMVCSGMRKRGDAVRTNRRVASGPRMTMITRDAGTTRAILLSVSSVTAAGLLPPKGITPRRARRQR